MEEEMLSVELESKKKKLDSWGRELNKREALTEREKKKLEEEKKQQVHDKLELKQETLFLAVNSLDRFLEKQVAKNKLQLVCLVTFLIASKYEEILPLVHGL
uniref:Cyclin N-terminal domain-containing protein n=1 Tax=Solanum lycopersicum TaxID=4081 RepID=A0A3Q7IVP7_SOLLC